MSPSTINLAYQAILGLGPSYPTEARQGGPVREAGSTGRQASNTFRDSPTSVIGEPYEDSAAHLLHICRGPRSNLCSTFGWRFSLWETPFPGQLTLFIIQWKLCPLQVPQYSPSSSLRFSALHLMFQCESLHPFPLACGKSISEYSYARFQSASIVEYSAKSWLSPLG